MSLLKKFKDKNIYLVSHSDLDGVGAVIICEYYLRPIVNEMFVYMEGEYELPDFDWDIAKSADYVIFTDMSPIDYAMYEELSKHTEVHILDHHISSYTMLGELPNYVFDVEKCGTKIAFEQLSKGKRVKPALRQFVELVNTYDLWKADQDLFDKAHNLHNILYGSVDWSRASYLTAYENYSKFISTQLYKINNYKNFFLTNNEKLLANRAKKKERDNYLQAKRTLSIRTDNSNNKYAYFSCVSKLSWVCYLLLEEYKDIEYLAGHATWAKDNSKISLRSRQGFEVSPIAELWGGGGHPNSAGLDLKSKEQLNDFKQGKLHLI